MGEKEERYMNELRRIKDKKCAKCRMNVRISRVIVKCKRCMLYFHNNCSGVTRSQLQGEVSRGEWRCKDCDIEIEELNKRRREKL